MRTKGISRQIVIIAKMFILKWHLICRSRRGCLNSLCNDGGLTLETSTFYNILPVGVSKHSIPSFCPTLSIAAPVGMLRATPFNPALAKYGIHFALSAITATESDGVTKNPFCPRIMLRSCREKKRKHSLASRRLLVMAYFPLWTVFISITSKQRSVKETFKPFRNRLSRLGNVQATSKNLRFN